MNQIICSVYVLQRAKERRRFKNIGLYYLHSFIGSTRESGGVSSHAAQVSASFFQCLEKSAADIACGSGKKNKWFHGEYLRAVASPWQLGADGLCLEMAGFPSGRHATATGLEVMS